MERVPVKDDQRSLTANLLGWHANQTTHSEINTWRRREAFAPLLSLANGFLRQADEQTLLSVRTVAQILEQQNRPVESLSEWGVVSAPRHLGRVLIEEDVKRFAKEGPTTVSPHVIAHRSLHAVSGTISMAFHSHGPNVGVGGGPGHVAQGLLASLCTLEEQALPGVLLTLSEWERDPMAGQITGEEVCRTLVLALTPSVEAQGNHTVSLTCGDSRDPGQEPPSSLTDLRDYLTSTDQAWSCQWDWGGQIHFTRQAQRLLRA